MSAAVPSPASSGARDPRAPARRFPSFRLLEILSFVHSAIYLLLLVFWLGPDDPTATMLLGWAHGVLWIGMSTLCIVAARRRTIPFWLAVTVAVVGGLGPFAGTIGFVYEERRRARIRVVQSS
jgi:hypothetical protein